MRDALDKIAAASAEVARLEAEMAKAVAALYALSHEAYLSKIRPGAIQDAWRAGGYVRSRETIGRAYMTGKPPGKKGPRR